MNRYYKSQRLQGFTLIEIMITLAIVGIVAAIAVPSYASYIINANRTDAMQFLLEVAGEQQRFFSENNAYASGMSALGYGADDTASSPEGLYTISVSTPDNGSSYQLSATPADGGRQVKDDVCQVFTIDSSGAKGNSGGSSADCW